MKDNPFTGKNFFIFLFFLFIIIFIYKGLFNSFYQQDEWLGIGRMLTENWVSVYTSYFSVTAIMGGAGRPLATPLQYFFYTAFPFKVEPFVISSIITHFFTGIMAFLVIKKITKNYFISIITGIFFITASAGQQAISWIAAGTTTLTSAFFVLLSIYLYLVYLENNRKRFFYLSFIAGVVAYLFKESAFFLFLFLPFLYVLFSKKRKINILNIIKNHWIYIMFAVYLFSIRIIDLFLTPKATAYFVSNNSPTLEAFIYRMITYPLVSFSQIFIPPETSFSFARHLVDILYPRLSASPIKELVAETIGSEMLSLVISFGLIVVFSFIFISRKIYQKTILFSALFTFFSFIPFIILSKSSGYLESRYFYLSVFGGAILFAIFFDYIRFLLIEKIKIPNILSTSIVTIVISVIFAQQVSIIQKDINMQIEVASERKAILSSLTNFLPRLPEKSILYINSDHDYYVIGNKLPFQQGTGYTLLVWYYPSGSTPKELLQEGYLWDLTSQGYKQVNSKGFGYYWDKDKLKDDIKTNKLNINNIYGFSYNSISKKLSNTTEKLRSELMSSNL